MTIRGAVFNPESTQIAEALVDDRVCECCPTAAAVPSSGPIVAFCNRTTDEIRDIYVSRLVGGKWTDAFPFTATNGRSPPARSMAPH
jgi:hypothetical protein